MALFPKITTVAIICALSLIVVSCSQQKNTAITRTYHNVNARYNSYFNGNDALKQGKMKIEQAHKEDYSKILPLDIFGNEEQVATVTTDLDRAIAKGSKTIQRHSIFIKNKEYCEWIDDSYLLIGKANFYKKDNQAAEENFRYVTRAFKDKETRYDAMLWMVRIFLRAKNFENAERLLKLIETEEEFPERLKQEYHEIYAQYYIDSKNYPLAISEMKSAVSLTKKKKRRARQLFIIAQLYKELGDLPKASNFYTQVIAQKPHYEMVFYATINRALAYDAEYGSSLALKEQLLKMAKDEKNEEYYDQIYFALAQIAFKENEDQVAVDYLIQSTKASVDNKNQKGLSFLELAKYHFDEKLYRQAQQYYDSTLLYINQDRPDYNELVILKNNLGQLVQYLETIEREDSLQMVAGLSEKEREKFIYNLIDELKDREEEERRRQETIEQNAEAAANSLTNSNPLDDNVDRSWYFYNASAMAVGANDFRKAWGTRADEDDWRRSNKQTVAKADGEEGEGELAQEEVQDPRYTLEYYIEGLPLTEEKLKASNEQIQKAYYDLGTLYKEEMSDDTNAFNTWEKLVTRYDTSNFHLSTYYLLYRLSQGLKYYDKEEKYKNKILNDYPKTEYARLIRDPNSGSEQEIKNKEITAYYEKTYGYYNRGYYEAAFEHAKNSKGLYPDNFLAPKFSFIEALCAGKTEGRSGIIGRLRTVITDYPDDPVKAEAEAIIAALENQEKEAKAAQAKAKEEAEKYKTNTDSKHNFIILIDSKEYDLGKMNSEISDFNKVNFSLSSLKVNSVIYKNEVFMVTVKDFKDAAEAVTYYKAFTSNKDKLADLNAKQFPCFIISFDNYPVFYKDKDTEGYLKFAKENYNL